MRYTEEEISVNELALNMSFVFVQIRFEEKKNLCFRLLNLSRRHSIKAIKLLLGIASPPPARKGGKRGKLSLDLEEKKPKLIYYLSRYIIKR